jgi:hypothetical protein
MGVFYFKQSLLERGNFSSFSASLFQKTLGRDTEKQFLRRRGPSLQHWQMFFVHPPRSLHSNRWLALFLPRRVRRPYRSFKLVSPPSTCNYRLPPSSLVRSNTILGKCARQIGPGKVAVIFRTINDSPTGTVQSFQFHSCA